MTENGKVDTEVAEQAVQVAAAVPHRYRLDSDELTPSDIKRARVMLNGKNPWEVLSHEDDMFTLMIWCFKSRTDPSFTWEQAENTPFGEFDPAVPNDPPPILPSEPLGRSESTLSGNESTPTRPKRTRVRDSEPSST
jgi:hypothetical protein